MKTVLVAMNLEPYHRQKLERAAPACRFVYAPGDELKEEMVRGADIIIGNPPPAWIGGSERLELLQLFSAGADPYIKPGVLAPGTRLTNATGAYGKAVSEHALALTLMLLKKLYRYRDFQREHSWRDAGMVTSLSDATVLVVGLGDIGLAYARQVKALGARVIGVKRRPGACPEGVDELWLTAELDRVLPEADVIFSILPGTADTFHFYTRERFSRMKPGAVFINCGRGSAVAMDVLADVLREGEIAAAAVDVTEVEPLPADSPLWELENLIITPHVAGNFHLADIREQVVEIAAQNLTALLAGEPLRNVVDFRTGYKK
jgi:phosphoglycerate dehydrogenase-like enzyme